MNDQGMLWAVALTAGMAAAIPACDGDGKSNDSGPAANLAGTTSLTGGSGGSPSTSGETTGSDNTAGAQSTGGATTTGGTSSAGAAGAGGVAPITEDDLSRCFSGSVCIVVPYQHCCGATKRAINEAYLDTYNAHPAWQSFDDPAACAVTGACMDDGNVTTAICEGLPEGHCTLVFP